MRFDDNSLGLGAPVVPWAYVAGSVAAATVLSLLSKRFFASPTHKNGIPLPPGPPATWFWENPMPKEHVLHKLAALVEQYGPVVSLRRGSHVTIVIGRMDAASEIMEKEGGALIDRPRAIATSELLSRGMRLAFISAGERLRRFRRVVHSHLQPKAARKYEEIQAETARDVILDILNDPKRHMQHAQRYASAVILRVTYGKTSPTSTDDPEVVRIHRVVANLQDTLKPGAYLVDIMPWLRYVPGYGRELEKFHQYELALFRDQLDRVKLDMATDNAGSSFAKMLLENTNDHKCSHDEMAYLAGGFFGAGSETSAAGITLMIMAAACHPDAQSRVQQELDEVVGKDRAPTFGDWDMLPQLHAFMLEALRWRPIVPLGLAHRATKDIVWRGQCIPAGATVLGCHWPISRDPVAFPDPETFNPKRWLTNEGRVRTDMHFYTYGFGRRVCPGQHVANRSIYINLATLLWSFRISQRPDALIDLGLSSFQNVVAFHPEPFEVDFTPRAEEQWLRKVMAQ